MVIVRVNSDAGNFLETSITVHTGQKPLLVALKARLGKTVSPAAPRSNRRHTYCPAATRSGGRKHADQLVTTMDGVARLAVIGSEQPHVPVLVHAVDINRATVWV